MLNYSVHLCYHLQIGHIMCYFNENYNTPKNILSITFQNLDGHMSSKGCNPSCSSWYAFETSGKVVQQISHPLVFFFHPHSEGDESSGVTIIA